ncbi:cytochrome P450 [Pluteus cervinus]|uniref:Cytochrome P450 n=1 Tax=Pluteus cervinus TaxID=181527 RepID=A0ACD3BBU4_9AGAR|nr:cytochrome P450 [Pluteus cervinus]
MVDYISLVVCASLLVISYVVKFRQGRHRLPLPPGPKPWPLIGNVLDMPMSTGWHTYAKWSKIYSSGILYASALGQKLIIVNSLEDAEQLLDERAGNTSDRPFLPMITLMGMDAHTALMKLLHQGLRKEVLTSYHHIYEKKAMELMHKLAKDPVHFSDHCRAYGPSIVMDIFYGYDLVDNDDPLWVESVYVLTESTNALLPGVFMVNTFPFLRHLPRWFPGAGFHDWALNMKKILRHMRDTPFDFALKNFSNGLGKPSLVIEWLQEDNGDETYEEVVREVAAGAFEAGIDSSSAAMDTLLLALTLNPEVQRKAQEEIRQIVGTTRLPTLRDRPFMPYLEAIYRETLRWAPPPPLGVPHATTEDDVYNGYLIPAGTFIMANIWAMTRNEKKYPEPELFRPERFLNPDGTLNDDDRVLAFGFGRRLCAGKHFASETLAMAQILASFNLSKAKDENGNEITLVDFRLGFAPPGVLHPSCSKFHMHR